LGSVVGKLDGNPLGSGKEEGSGGIEGNGALVDPALPELALAPGCGCPPPPAGGLAPPVPGGGRDACVVVSFNGSTVSPVPVDCAVTTAVALSSVAVVGADDVAVAAGPPPPFPVPFCSFATTTTTAPTPSKSGTASHNQARVLRLRNCGARSCAARRPCDAGVGAGSAGPYAAGVSPGVGESRDGAAV
jgi:hypothetical protein